MTSEEALAKMIDVLNAAGFPYVVVGSFASNFHGVPRSTQDADIVLELGPMSIHEIVRNLGTGFRLDPQMSFETLTGTYRYILHIEQSTFKIELFLLSDRPYDQERFRRRLPVELVGRNTFILTPEDVVVTKLRWAGAPGREKDTLDIRNVLLVQGDRLDWEYIYRWCDEHGTREILDQIRQSGPPI